ncbi:MAG TPA: monovalent cation/H(+) antiporter subunit G [Candidatus Thermoplasmatota archaeon]|nr:monovalent cation/H(+) antiporter subunit G [Candidatus Thermoplasmatota archaeon]
MMDLVAAALAILGALFMLLASVGILRMPDLFTRMSTTSKAGTLGAGLMFLAVAVAFPDLGVKTRALAGIFFLLLTAPVAAHMIGRAGYVAGVTLWGRTVTDELRGKYDARMEHLESTDLPPPKGRKPPR